MSSLGLATLPSALATKLHHTPFAACVGLGLAANSYFFLGNLACSTIGVLPAIKGTNVDEEKSVELWAYFYEKAAPQFITSASIATGSYWLAAKLANPVYISLRPWLVAAGLCSLSVLPYTLYIMMPVNKPLLATRDQVVKDRAFRTDGSSLRLIEQWRKLHVGRMAASGVSWFIGLSVLILA